MFFDHNARFYLQFSLKSGLEARVDHLGNFYAFAKQRFIFMLCNLLF
jgi:hypothetical protein